GGRGSDREGLDIEREERLLARMEIDGSAMRANYRTVSGLLEPGCRVIAVVKADAYGLGLVPAARVLAGEGCLHFAVATVAEGVELRDCGIGGEILVLGSIPPRQAPEVVEWGLSATCGDMGLAQ